MGAECHQQRDGDPAHLRPGVRGRILQQHRWAGTQPRRLARSHHRIGAGLGSRCKRAGVRAGARARGGVPGRRVQRRRIGDAQSRRRRGSADGRCDGLGRQLERHRALARDRRELRLHRRRVLVHDGRASWQSGGAHARRDRAMSLDLAHPATAALWCHRRSLRRHAHSQRRDRPVLLRLELRHFAHWAELEPGHRSARGHTHLGRQLGVHDHRDGHARLLGERGLHAWRDRPVHRRQRRGRRWRALPVPGADRRERAIHVHERGCDRPAGHERHLPARCGEAPTGHAREPRQQRASRHVGVRVRESLVPGHRPGGWPLRGRYPAAGIPVRCHHRRHTVHARRGRTGPGRTGQHHGHLGAGARLHQCPGRGGRGRPGLRGRSRVHARGLARHAARWHRERGLQPAHLRDGRRGTVHVRAQRRCVAPGADAVDDRSARGCVLAGWNVRVHRPGHRGHRVRGESVVLHRRHLPDDHGDAAVPA